MNHLFTGITECTTCGAIDAHHHTLVIKKENDDSLCAKCNKSSNEHHTFVKNPLCSFCNFNYLAHTPAARCQNCNKCGSCNVVDSMLLCDKCAEGIKSKQYDLIERSRKIDAELKGNQDFYNAATIPIIELKKTIMEDETIINKDEALKEELFTRVMSWKTRIFELDNELDGARLNLSVASHNLDEFEHLLRKEQREALKNADNNYVPPLRSKTVKVKLTKSVNSEVDKFNEQIKLFMKLHEVTETEARLKLIEHYNRMGKKLPE